MKSGKSPPRIETGLLLHAGCLSVLLTLAWLTWNLLGRPYPIAYWIAIGLPVVHQVFVWIAWRLELQSQWTSRQIGFQGYVAGFFICFGGRFISLIVLGFLDRGSLHLPMPIQILLTLMLVSAGGFAMYSVKRYFGMARAAGADHFDPTYRDLPMVKKGIFRFTKNGMYVYAFMLFWAIAIGFNSSAALAVAAFSHAYIWVHFYATEQPDMKYIYESTFDN